MSVQLEYRSGVLSSVNVMVAELKSVGRTDEVESVAFETMDGTTIRIYGKPGLLDTLALDARTLRWPVVTA